MIDSIQIEVSLQNKLNHQTKLSERVIVERFEIKKCLNHVILSAYKTAAHLIVIY